MYGISGKEQTRSDYFFRALSEVKGRHRGEGTRSTHHPGVANVKEL